MFERDMMFDIQRYVDWQLICERKLARMKENNARENLRQVEHDYTLGGLVNLMKADLLNMSRRPRSNYAVTYKWYCNFLER